MKTTNHQNWALIGTPNSGKTALFNALTGSHQRVANYSGVTVDSVQGELRIKDKTIQIHDLPGTYSLNPLSDDEKITTDILLGKNSDLKLDGMIVVLDSTQMWRNLAFAVELSEIRIKKVFVLNLSDLSKKRNQNLDLELFEKELEAPVVECVATRRKGLQELTTAVSDLLSKDAVFLEKKQNSEFLDPNQNVLERFKIVDRLYKGIVKTPARADLFSKRMDQIVLHPILGPVFLMFVVGLIFQGVFNLSEAPVSWIESVFAWVGDWFKTVIPEGMLQSFVVDGLVAGVGGTVVFLPQILILFAAILFMEDFGYMARAVVILDRWMSKLGLHSKAFFPLFSSFACAIPGIMATRAIENKKDRMTTLLMAPLITCSARLPVYALLISTFIPNDRVLPGIGMQGLVLFGLYVLGVLCALAFGFVLKKFVFQGKTQPLLIELPSYKVPNLESILRGLWFRAKVFLRRISTMIVGLTVLIWVLVTFPRTEGLSNREQVEQSYAAKLGHALEPMMRPLGYDWRISMALVPAFGAREVMVSALNTVYAVEGEDALDDDQKEQKLKDIIRGQWSLPVALSLMVWFAISPQCISTLAVIRREAGSWKWVGFSLVMLLSLAYIAAFLTFQISSFFLV